MFTTEGVNIGVLLFFAAGQANVSMLVTVPDGATVRLLSDEITLLVPGQSPVRVRLGDAQLIGAYPPIKQPIDTPIVGGSRPGARGTRLDARYVSTGAISLARSEVLYIRAPSVTVNNHHVNLPEITMTRRTHHHFMAAINC
jgi:hypothetical protein